MAEQASLSRSGRSRGQSSQRGSAQGSAYPGNPKPLQSLQSRRSLGNITDLPSSSFTPEVATEPWIEPNSNPNIPSNFTSPYTRPYYNENDQQFHLFFQISNQIDDMLGNERYGLQQCAVIDLITIGKAFDDEGFRFYDNPVVLAIRMGPSDRDRWSNIDKPIRDIIHHHWSRAELSVPPIRYYFTTWSLV